MTQVFNENKKLNQVTLNDIKEGFTFENNLSNVLKFMLLGAYIQNDAFQIDQLESLFKASGSLHNKRSYKTEAQFVYNKLKAMEYIATGDSVSKFYSLSDISNWSIDYAKDQFSIGTAYKMRNTINGIGEPIEKQEKNPSAKFDKDVIKSLKEIEPNIKAMLDNKNSPFHSLAVEHYNLELEKQKFETLYRTLPNPDSDQYVKLVSLMLQSLHKNNHAGFESVMLNAMTLDNQNMETQEAA